MNVESRTLFIKAFRLGGRGSNRQAPITHHEIGALIAHLPHYTHSDNASYKD